MKVFNWIAAALLILVTTISVVAVPPPAPEHASGNFKIVCRNARLRINTLPFAISTAQCYGVNYTTDISMFANGRELDIPVYAAGQWPMAAGQQDRILDLQIGVFEANSDAGPHLWIMLTDYWNSSNRMWVDMFSLDIYPASVRLNAPDTLFGFNQMLSEYSPAINSGAQLLGTRVWGGFGADEWYRGPSANPRFVNYNHGWALDSNIPYADGNGVFDLSTLYSANTKIVTTVTNVRQTFTPSINGIENPWDHLGDLVFEVYDPTVPGAIGDFNGSATCDTGDLFDFLESYFGNCLSSDLNNDLETNVGDLFTFLNCWFEGQ